VSSSPRGWLLGSRSGRPFLPCLWLLLHHLPSSLKSPRGADRQQPTTQRPAPPGASGGIQETHSFLHCTFRCAWVWGGEHPYPSTSAWPDPGQWTCGGALNPLPPFSTPTPVTEGSPGSPGLNGAQDSAVRSCHSPTRPPPAATPPLQGQAEGKGVNARAPGGRAGPEVWIGWMGEARVPQPRVCSGQVGAGNRNPEGLGEPRESPSAPMQAWGCADSALGGIAGPPPPLRLGQQAG
jgi:hypothetical protein